MPFGFCNSLAIFASSLFGATPTEQPRPVRSWIACCRRARERAAAVGIDAGQAGEIDVHLVDAAVFHHGRDAGDHFLEGARVFAVLLEVRRQQDRVGAQLRRLHQPQPGVHAEGPRRIGRRRDHAAADVVLQPLVPARAPGAGLAALPPAPADHHRLAREFRVAQQLDGGVERIHVEVRDATARRGGRVLQRICRVHPVGVPRARPRSTWRRRRSICSPSMASAAGAICSTPPCMKPPTL